MRIVKAAGLEPGAMSPLQGKRARRSPLSPLHGEVVASSSSPSTSPTSTLAAESLQQAYHNHHSNHNSLSISTVPHTASETETPTNGSSTPSSPTSPRPADFPAEGGDVLPVRVHVAHFTDRQEKLRDTMTPPMHRRAATTNDAPAAQQPRVGTSSTNTSSSSLAPAPIQTQQLISEHAATSSARPRSMVFSAMASALSSMQSLAGASVEADDVVEQREKALCQCMQEQLDVYADTVHTLTERLEAVQGKFERLTGEVAAVEQRHEEVQALLEAEKQRSAVWHADDVAALVGSSSDNNADENDALLDAYAERWLVAHTAGQEDRAAVCRQLIADVSQLKSRIMRAAGPEALQHIVGDAAQLMHRAAQCFT